MSATEIDIKTQDGVADCHYFLPESSGPSPAVIFYMDGLGSRQSLYDMAERLAQNGYAVLLPNMYYRSQPAGAVDFTKDREKMMGLIMALTNEAVMLDTETFLAFLDADLRVDAST